MSFSWQHYNWNARPSDAGSSTSLPGPNHWSDSSANVSVDGSGFLHLAVTFDGTYWRCSEVDNTAALGYGQYQWTVDFKNVGDPMAWDDPSYVFGLSVYDSSAPLYYRESDITFSLFGSSSTASPGLFLLNESTGAENNSANFILTRNGPYTCTLIWQSGQLYFSVADSESAICGEHLISGSAVPSPGSAVARMSAWLNGGNPPGTGETSSLYGDGDYGGGGYADSLPFDVIVRSFTFAAGVTHSIASASSFSAPFTAKSNIVLLHRPGPDSPDTLNPVVPVSSADQPSYSNSYPVISLTPGVNAKFNGTYSVLVSASHWDTPDASRYIEVVVTQRDFVGDFANDNKRNHPALAGTFTPSVDSYGALLLVGEITLPVNDLPPENFDSYFTVTPYSDNPLDRFQEVIFLDVKGQTVLVSMPGFGYDNYYFDEPDTDRDLGYITGSFATRERASSVLQYARLSGGPLTADPGSNVLVAYGLPQGPGISGTYSPRWWADRLGAS